MAHAGHGYRVMTRIVTQRRIDALKIPVGALFREGDGWATFLSELYHPDLATRKRLKQTHFS